MTVQAVKHSFASSPQPCPCGVASCRGWLTGGRCQGACPSWLTLLQQECSGPPLSRQPKLTPQASCSRQGGTISVGPTIAMPHFGASVQLLHTHKYLCPDSYAMLIATAAHPELASAQCSSAATSRLRCSVQALPTLGRARPSTVVSALRRRQAALLCAGSGLSTEGTLSTHVASQDQMQLKVRWSPPVK